MGNSFFFQRSLSQFFIFLLTSEKLLRWTISNESLIAGKNPSSWNNPGRRTKKFLFITSVWNIFFRFFYALTLFFIFTKWIWWHSILINYIFQWFNSDLFFSRCMIGLLLSCFPLKRNKPLVMEAEQLQPSVQRLPLCYRYNPWLVWF